MKLRPIPKPDNDVLISNYNSNMSLDAKSGYHFSEFRWNNEEIPKEFSRDTDGNIIFYPDNGQYFFLIPHQNSKQVLEVLMSDIRKDFENINPENLFYPNKVKNICFHSIENNGMAVVKFLYEGKPRSFPFPLRFIQKGSQLDVGYTFPDDVVTSNNSIIFSIIDGGKKD